MSSEMLEPNQDVWQKHFCKSKVDGKYFGVAFRGRLDNGSKIESSRWEHFIHTSWHSSEESANIALDLVIETFGQ